MPVTLLWAAIEPSGSASPRSLTTRLPVTFTAICGQFIGRSDFRLDFRALFFAQLFKLFAIMLQIRPVDRRDLLHPFITLGFSSH